MFEILSPPPTVGSVQETSLWPINSSSIQWWNKPRNRIPESFIRTLLIHQERGITCFESENISFRKEEGGVRFEGDWAQRLLLPCPGTMFFFLKFSFTLSFSLSLLRYFSIICLFVSLFDFFFLQPKAQRNMQSRRTMNQRQVQVPRIICFLFARRCSCLFDNLNQDNLS